MFSWLVRPGFTTIFIVFFSGIAHCNGDACHCYCCTGNSCTLTLQGNISVPFCISSSCPSLCKSTYPLKCTDDPGKTNYQCRSGSGSTPIWPGTFTMGNECDRTTCCCPGGQMVLSSVGDSALRIQCQLSGQECPEESASYDETIAMPTGFNSRVYFMGSSFPLLLSEDSRALQFTNPSFPRCSESATRNESPATSPSPAVSSTRSAGSITLVSFAILIGSLTAKQLII